MSVGEFGRGCKSFFGSIVLAVLVSVVLLTFGIRIFGSQGIQKREQGLVLEFQDIVHPNGANQISFQIKSKIIRRWIMAQYKYNLNAAEIENYYDQELLPKGWSKVSVSKTEYEAFHHFRYKKGNYEIIFSPFKDSWLIKIYLRDFYDELGT